MMNDKTHKRVIAIAIVLAFIWSIDVSALYIYGATVPPGFTRKEGGLWEGAYEHYLAVKVTK